MNFTENEYLIPIFLGRSSENKKAAAKVLTLTGIKAHFFAPRFSLIERLRYHCHPVVPFRGCWLAESLICFADSAEEFYSPVILLCDAFARDFIKEYGDAVESLFVAMEIEDFLKEDGLAVGKEARSFK
jgi:hypothetical protein